MRLIAEGVVIVCSILLAFAIDAGWAARQLRVEEREALAALEAEFTSNLQQINAVIQMHTAWLEFVRMLVELPEEHITALPQETVSEIMLATANPTTFDPVLGTTTSLVQAGKLGVLQDARLREALSTFENFVADAEHDAELLFALAPDVWRALIPYGAPWSDPVTEVGTAGAVKGLDFLPRATAEDLLNVRADQEVMGLVNYFHWNVGYYLVELRRIQTQLSIVLELIGESRG
ncbi:MAG: hypothetical protein ACR2QM_13685 [Longimicrobiales bacterium]